MNQNQYYFCVGAVFKNESIILQEWIEHYLFHGAQHIYLVNDQSTDNYLPILQPYIDKNIVTLMHTQEPIYEGRQRVIYDTFFLPLLHQKVMKWLFICDLDEFLWSAHFVDITHVLKMLENLAQIQIDSDLFGSNGLEKQPKYIIPHFIRRAPYPEDIKKTRNFKYIINSHFAFRTLGVHTAYFQDEQYHSGKYFQRIDYSTDKEKPWFVLNHYVFQSKDYWTKIKMTRGDLDNHRKRTIDNFFDNSINYNQIEDNRLFEQNKPIYDKLTTENHIPIDFRIDLS
jgi:hypothetical protein